MFIVWSGWGLLVPVFNIVGILALLSTSAAIEKITGRGPALHTGEAIAGAFWAAITAAAIYVAVAKLEDRARDRVLVDETTGERLVQRKSAGSFFFIPTRYWTFGTLAVWALLVFAIVTAPPECTTPGQANCTAAPAVAAAPVATPL